MLHNVSQLNLVRFNNTKLDKMEELIKTLEEIKEHQMQTVQLARTTTVYKLADKAINQALSLAAVVGRSELLPLEFIKWYSGMEQEKILKAYERWKTEERQ